MMQVPEYAHVRLKSVLTGTIVEVIGGGEACEFERDNPGEYGPDDVWRTITDADIAEIVEDTEG